MWLATPNKKIIDRLDGLENLSVKLNYMNQNELSFNLNSHLFDDLKMEQYKNPATKLIKNKYMLKFEYNNQTEWFIIDNLAKTSDTKDFIPVVAHFVGKELNKKYIGDIEEIGVTISQVLNKYLPIVAPNWSIGEIDKAVKSIKREYSLSDATVTSLLEEIADLTDSIVVFDNDKRKLNFVHKDKAGTFKGLKIEEETYLKEFTDSYQSDDLTTRLILLGKDGMTINGINPAGTSYIEDFSYYMKPFKRDSRRNVLEHSDYMSDELCHALLDYEELFANQRRQFENTNEDYESLFAEQLEEEFKLSELLGIRNRLEERFEVLETRDAIKKTRVLNSGVNNVNFRMGTQYIILLHNRGSLARVTFLGDTHLIGHEEDAYLRVSVPSAQSPDDTVRTHAFNILATRTDIDFTIVEASSDDYNSTDLDELDKRYNLRKYNQMYEYQRTIVASVERRLNLLQSDIGYIQNLLNPRNFFTPELFSERENFVSWGVWREDSHIDPSKLLDDGLRQLKDHSNVKREVTVGIVDFLQSIEDAENWDKLSTGDIIRFSNNAFDTKIQAFINEITIDFDNHSIELEISDVLDLKDMSQSIGKRLASFVSTANQVNMQKREIDENFKKTNEVMKLLEGEWDANKQRILAGNETVEMSDKGLVITSPTHPNEMLVAVAGVIAISDDNGETFKQAINTRGVVAERIVGKLIMGTELIMENDSGTVRFDNEGLRVNADYFHLTTGGGEDYFDKLLHDIRGEIISYEESVTKQIEEQRESVSQEAKDLEKALKDFTTDMTNSMADGILDLQEIHYLQLQMNLISAEYEQVNRRVLEAIQTHNIEPMIQELLYQKSKELEADYTYLKMFIQDLGEEIVKLPKETIEKLKETLMRFKPTIDEVLILMERALLNIQDNRIARLEYDTKELHERLTDEFLDELDDLKDSLGDFNEAFFDALSDGILSNVERKILDDFLLRVTSEKGDLNERHSIISNHYMLVDTDEKTDLDNAKVEVDTKFVTLLNEIANIKELAYISSADVEKYRVAYNEYTSILEEYVVLYELATIKLQNQYTDDKQGEAQAYADGLMIDVQANVDDVDRRVNAFKDDVYGAFLDGIITESERNRLAVHHDMLVKEKADVISRYSLIITSEYLVGYYDLENLITARQVYGETHAELLLQLELAMMDDIITKEESDTVLGLFETYVENLVTFSTELETAIIVLGESKAVALTQEQLEEYVSIVEFQAELVSLQAQLDGKIVTHYYEHEPTLNNLPASEWKPSSYETRVGDLFYNIETGYAYRFLNDSGTYKWKRIEDSDVTRALADSQNALDLADNKRRVFVATPKPPYDIGDLWLTDDGEMMRARVNKSDGTNFSEADWVLATKYTDDAKANAVSNELGAYKQINNQEIADLKGSLTSFRKTVEGVFRDGIVSEQELSILKMQQQALTREKNDVDSGYNKLLNNPKLEGIFKSNLQSAYTSFVTVHQQLMTKIDQVVSDGIIENGEYDEVMTLLDAYPVELLNYKNVMNETFNELIQIAQRTADESLEEAKRFESWRSTTFEVEAGKVAQNISESHWVSTGKAALGDLQQQVDDTKAELDNLEIGARNLILGTSYDEQEFNFSGYNKNIGKVSDFGMQELRKGGEFTITVDITEFEDNGAPGIGVILQIYADDTLHQYTSTYGAGHAILNAGETGTITYTFNVAPRDYSGDGWVRLRNTSPNSTSNIGKYARPRMNMGTSARTYSEAPEDTDAKITELNQSISEAKQSLTDFEETVNTTFKDGIIEEAEAKSIRVHQRNLEKERAEIDQRYETIYSNEKLKSSPKTNLKSAKTTYDTAHNNLLSYINNLVSKGKVTTAESNEVNTRFNTYRGALSTLTRRFEEAILFISEYYAQSAANDALEDYHNTVITQQYSTREDTNKLLASYVTDATYTANLDQMGSALNQYEVRTSKPSVLTEVSGSEFKLGFSYEVTARITEGTSVDTLAVAVFLSKNNGRDWQLVKLKENGVTSIHPEFFIDSNNKPAIRLYNSTAIHKVDVAYTKYAGEQTGMQRAQTHIEQRAREVLIGATNIAEGKRANLLVNPTATGYLRSSIVENDEVVYLDDGWESTSGLTMETVDFLGRQANVIRVRNSENSVYNSYLFNIDPTKTYEFTAWIRKSTSHGRYYLGFRPYKDGSIVSIEDGVSTWDTGTGTLQYENSTAPYFIYSNANTSSTEWIKVSSYIFAYGTPDFTQDELKKFIANHEGHRNFITRFESLEPNQLTMRILNYNTTGTNDVFVASPSLKEVSEEDIRKMAQIRVSSDEISLEVSKKVGNDEIISRINQSPETISLDASKIVFDVSGRNLVEEVDKINNDKIGTRNLIPNTTLPGDRDSWEVWSTGKTNLTTSSWFTDFLWVNNPAGSTSTNVTAITPNTVIPLVEGNEYVLTFHIVHMINIHDSFNYVYLRDSSGSTHSISIANISRKEIGAYPGRTEMVYEYTVRIVPPLTSHYQILIGSRVVNEGSAARLYLSKPMLVEGTKPATYSRALEDTDAKITSLDQQIKDIELTPGPPGKDGSSSYTHIAYAKGTAGQSFSVNHFADATHIGMYVSTSTSSSNNWRDYKWSQIKGVDGANGIPGTDGEDGRTPYFHTAWANNSTGTSGFSTTVSLGKTYIGTYTDFVEADSSNPAKYNWVLIKGEKGDKGDQGIQGPKGANGTSQYIHIRYSANSNGSGMTTNPSSTTKYIGLANTSSSTAPSTISSYTWSKYRGEDGDQGIQGPPGANGEPTYTWVKYADTPTSGMNDSPDGKKYIGLAFNKSTPKESSSYSQYTWSLMPQNIALGVRNLIPYTDFSNYGKVYREWSTWGSPRIWGGSYDGKFMRYTHENTDREGTGFIGIISPPLVTDVRAGRTYTLRWLARNPGTTSVPNPFDYSYLMNVDNVEKEGGTGTGNQSLSNPTIIEGVDYFGGGNSRVDLYSITFTPTWNGPAAIMLASGTRVDRVVNMYVAEIMLVEGDTAPFDYVPAIEDGEREIHNAVDEKMDEINAELSVHWEAIGDKVSTATFTDALNSMIADYEDGLIEASKVPERVETLLSRNESMISRLGDNIAKWEFLDTHVRLGDEGLYIGDIEGDSALLVSKDRISFMQGQNEIAYISGQQMYINRSINVESMQVGSHVQMKIDDNNTVIQWVGG